MLPNYWLPQPTMDLNPQKCSAFDQLLADAERAGTPVLIQYTLPFPKWQFLCYVAEQHNVALHGTGNPSIRVFEPRQPVDLTAFGNQKAVYAAGDGLWAMFFAVIDREHYPMSMNNACIRLADTAGWVSEPHYVFSISQTALQQQPWRTGFVYLLPREPFTVQPSQPYGAYEVHIPQLASFEPVVPLARLAIKPVDFPFLSAILPHEDERLHEYAHALQTGGSWPDSSVK